jgi:serine kinase of HPr protein (carbohydrate metabolism regulator)
LPATSPLAEYLPVQLVADDQVLLRRAAEHVIASVPEAIRGLMEVRGVGLVRVATTPEVNLALVVELVGADEVPRFPDPALCVTVCGIDVPCLRLQAAAASAPLKVLMALTKTARPG